MGNHTNTRSVIRMAFLSRFSPDPRTFRSCLFDYHRIYRATWIFPGPFLNNILLLPAVCFSLLRSINMKHFRPTHSFSPSWQSYHLYSLAFWTITFIYLAWMSRNAHTWECMRRSEKSLHKSLLSFCHMSIADPTQGVTLGGQHTSTFTHENISLAPFYIPSIVHI